MTIFKPRWLSTELIALGLLLLTTVAELALLADNPLYSLLLHLILTLTISGLAVWQDEESAEYRFYLSLLLIPLIRLLSLSLPLAAWSQTSWYFVVSVPLFTGMFVMIRRFNFGRDDLLLGKFRWLPELAIGLIGVPLGLMEFLILDPIPLIPAFSLRAFIVPALTLLICTGLLEELLFRGLLEKTSTAVLPSAAALWFVSGLFAVLHIGYASLLDVLFVFSVGFLFGILSRKTNSILGVTIAHGLTNIGMFLVWPFILG